MDDEEYDEDDFGVEDDCDDEGLIESPLLDCDIEEAGVFDGESDAKYDSLYAQYGASINLDSLSDEQKDVYDSAYFFGYGMSK